MRRLGLAPDLQVRLPPDRGWKVVRWIWRQLDTLPVIRARLRRAFARR